MTCKGLGSSKALLQSEVPQVQCGFGTWSQRLGCFLLWDWKYLCGNAPNADAVIPQGPCRSSRRRCAEDVFPLDNAVQEEQAWLWLHLPVTDAQPGGTGEQKLNNPWCPAPYSCPTPGPWAPSVIKHTANNGEGSIPQCMTASPRNAAKAIYPTQI